MATGTRSDSELIEVRKKNLISTAITYYKNPLHLVKAKGTRVYDSSGREYLDAIGGIVSISAGHNHPKIKKAIMGMLEEDEIQHTTLLYVSRHVVNLSEKLLSKSPAKLSKCAFTNSGSEANELAFMAARHATGETIIINLRHSYHGGTAATLAQCGHHNWRFRAQPVTAAVSALEPNCYRCPFGQKPQSCNLECAQNVESTIQTATHGKIAGFIAEPIMGVGGFITPPKDYFTQVAKIVHNYGGKYISDEVQTGAGRCGKEFFLTKEYGIDADVITMAKGFGNGAAIGAAVMTPEISDTLTGKLYFNTFGGDPYQTLQAKITIDIIDEEGLIENANRMGQMLTEGLLDLQKKHPMIGDVRGRGLLMGFEMVKDPKTKAYAPDETAKLMELCKEKGLLIGKGGLFGNVIRIAPPLTINKDDVSFMLKTIEESLIAVGA